MGVTTLIDMVGRTYGRLTVLSFAGRINNGRSYLCLCSCGRHHTVLGKYLRSGESKSCGCYKPEKTRLVHTTHGESKHPLHKVFSGILQRCYYKKQINYSSYGGRGITVCKEWLSNYLAFKEWAISNGWKKGMQIHRLNNNGPYSPENCTLMSSHDHTVFHHTKLLTFNGKTMSQKEWAKLIGINPATLSERIAKWPLEKALSTPKQSCKNSS